MKKPLLFTFSFTLFISTLFSQPAINGNFESKNANGRLKHWDITYKTGSAKGYIASLDSVTKQEGKYSLLICEDPKVKEKNFGACAATILSRYQGTSVTLKGYLKTEAVQNGWAGLWVRINDDKEMLEFNNMQNEPVVGNTNWTEYSITLPLSQNANKIVIGGILVGQGKAWFDNLRVFIDNVPIEKAKLRVD